MWGERLARRGKRNSARFRRAREPFAVFLFLPLDKTRILRIMFTVFTKVNIDNR
jgi:hypothetical protein